jgi:hypothetical protein
MISVMETGGKYMKNDNWLELIIGWGLIVIVGYLFVVYIPELIISGSYEQRFIFACTLFISFLLWFCFVRLTVIIKKSNGSNSK